MTDKTEPRPSGEGRGLNTGRLITSPDNPADRNSQDAADEIARLVPLKCNGCTACCRGGRGTEVALLDDDWSPSESGPDPDTVEMFFAHPDKTELAERGGYLHPLAQGNFPPEMLAELRAKGVTHFWFALKRKPNGDCIHLTEQGCSIYERRPIVCRRFDCRTKYGHLPRGARRWLIKHGHITEEVIEAGRTRLREAQAEIQALNPDQRRRP